MEEGGRYLRRVNTFLEDFPPERRGPSLSALSESTLQGACAIRAEPLSLPVRARVASKAQVEWASHEASQLRPGSETASDESAPKASDSSQGHLSGPRSGWS